MLSYLSTILIVGSALLSIPIAVLFIEVIAALNAVEEKDWESASAGDKNSVAVIVPAHNESTGVVPTITDIKPQLWPGDRLIVVADNCSDDTAAAATAAGAEVVLRNDLTKIGKGYALGYGISHLESDPPDFVVFIDADCRIQSDMIGRLKEVCQHKQRPVQACFLMKAPEGVTVDHSFAEFAWILKNWVRPLGLRYLNCPVQLMGTGMIFPWQVIHGAPLASGNLVEDMKLGLDLAAVGKAPYFFPFVIGTSEFPVSDKGTNSQRQRWVQGHIATILGMTPRLLFLAIKRRNLDLLVLALDLAVPPLSLLGLMLVTAFGLACLSLLLGASVAPLALATTNLATFAVTIYLAWLKYGRVVLPVHALSTIGPLILKRLQLYSEMALGRTATSWVRTDRSKQK
jgi:cellulose synthase/poly-beta-1,6-N-acetylglucosamine synthase-like glycosyltransferase